VVEVETVTLPESPAASACAAFVMASCVWDAVDPKSAVAVDVRAMSSKSRGSSTITGTATDLNFVLTCVSVTDSEMTTSALPVASAVVVAEPATAVTA
jgi:hypothetical protein